MGEPWLEQPVDVKRRVGRDGIEIFGQGGEVAVTRVVVHLPFDGEQVFFSLRPNQYSFNPPTADITASDLRLVYEDRSFDPKALRERIDRDCLQIEEWLSWSRAMAGQHNARLPEVVRDAIRDRKRRILESRSMAASLGMPIRQRGDVNAPPMKRQSLRAQARRPTSVPSTFQPEPAMDEADFEEAVRLIRSAGVQMERSPTTTLRQSEEERRDWILVTLNSQFEGTSGGEVFNGAGKTDILIRVGDRNVFVGECKIWRGASEFSKAIDQLLSYVVWRDTKAALILFVQNRDASAVIEKAADALSSHERCRRALDSGDSTTRQDYVFSGDADAGRDIHVAFLPIVIRPVAESDEPYHQAV